jgi:hypothetical protein
LIPFDKNIFTANLSAENQPGSEAKPIVSVRSIHKLITPGNFGNIRNQKPYAYQSAWLELLIFVLAQISHNG